VNEFNILYYQFIDMYDNGCQICCVTGPRRLREIETDKQTDREKTFRFSNEDASHFNFYTFKCSRLLKKVKSGLLQSVSTLKLTKK